MKSRLWFIFVTIIALCQTAEGSSVGRTAGQFVVSPTGAAQYTIPIWAPPGPHGLQPNIALTYNSQSGNGPLGMGWSISGLSAIAQCNSTYAQDPPASGSVNYPARYCLDGNRMRLTSSETLSTYGNASTTYQTEIADFSNITASSTMKGIAPMFFTVQRRDGLTFEYGNGGNSQIAANGSAVQWYLDKVTDRAGNTMTITYLAPGANLTGGEVPATISWTPSSHGSSTYIYTMQFTYGSTTVPAKVGYLQASSASPYLNATSLTNVEIAISGTVVKNYVLNYTASTTTGRKTLTSVTECADSGATNCLLPTAISYKKPAIGIPTVDTLTGSGATNGTTNAVDFNGDGLTDIVFARTSGSSNHWYVQFALANSGGFGSPVDTGVTTNATDPVLFDDFLAEGRNDFLVLQSGVWYVVRWNGTSFVSTSTGLTLTNRQTASPYGPSSIVSADVDGDGRPDLVWEGLDNKLYVTLNTSASGVVSFSATSNSVGGSTSYLGYLFGNNSFSNTSARHLDFDGDGRGDVMYWASGTLTTLMSRGTTPMFTNALLPEATLRAFVPVNWNDDSCTDIADLSAVHLTSCGGTPSTITLNGGSAIGTTLVALDWDGDGRTDLLSTNSGDLSLYRSTGNGVAAGGDTGLSVLTASIFLVMDANGDGLDDLAYLAPRSSDAINYGYHYFSGLPDLMSSIADGYGNSISPTYVSIAQSNYTQYSDAIFGYENYIGPLSVVSEAVFSDPSTAGATYNQQFQYYGAWTNVQGRGFQAFLAIRSVDSRNGLYDYTYYDRGFPTTGLVNRTDHVQATGSSEITLIQNITASLSLDPTQYNVRYFPYISASTRSDYEVGGTENTDLITTTTTDYTFDNYGNATNIVQTVTDNDPGSPYTGDTWTTNTTNTTDISANPTGDLAAWCLTMLDQTQVVYSSMINGANTVTRTKTFTPDTPANCRIVSAITEPTVNSGLYKVTEALTFDNFGNIHTDTVTGAHMPASPPSRLTTLNWGTTGQFLSSVTDPSSATTTAAYTSLQSLTFGVPDSVTDPNNLTTSWTYDAFGRKAKETRPDSTSTTWTWSTCTTFCGWSNSFYQIAQTNYQTNGLTIIRTDTNFYDPIDRVTETSGPTLPNATAIVQNLYNSLGLVTQVSLPYLSGSSAYQQTFSYDLLNRPMAVTRPISSTNSTPQSTSYTYAGRTLTVSDPYSHAKKLVYDVSGKLRKTTDAIGTGYTVTRSYDAAGTLNGITDSVGNSLLSNVTINYGIRPFRIAETDADLGSWTFTFDSLGERTNWTDAKGQSFSMTYDALSRALTRQEPDLFSQWTYGATPASHNVGQLISECSGTTGGPPPSSCGTPAIFSEARAFDSVGRLSTRTIAESADPGNDPGGVFLFTYNYSATTGLPSTLTYPISTSGVALNLQYAYQYGILQSVTDTTDTAATCGSTCTLWTANSMTALGQVAQETLGNNVVTNRTYDPVTFWLLKATAGVGGGSVLLNQSYLQDENGNVTQRQNNNLGLTESFSYDADNRLTCTVLGSTCSSATFAYDNGVAGPGKITSHTGVGTYNYPAPGQPRPHAATSITGFAYGVNNPSFSYDANGNMTDRASTSQNILWTSYNYPYSISGADSTGTGTVALNYGPDRQRVQQNYSVNGGSIESTFYVGGLMDIVKLSGTVDYRHYIYAGGEPVAVYSRTAAGVSTMSYILGDPLGGVSTIASNAGAADVNESFAAFGNRRNSGTWSGAPTTTDLTFSKYTRQSYTFQTTLGQNMSLNHMNGRVQDAVLGGFLSPDPHITDPSNGQSYNRYSYVINNPLTFTDPTGFTCTASLAFHPGQGGSSEPDENGNFPDLIVTGSSWTSTLSCDEPQDPRSDRGGGQGDSLEKIVVTARKITHCPAPNISPSQLSDLLPDKGILDQIKTGVSSYIQGVAWGATAIASRLGAFGPDLQSQAMDTNTQLVNTWNFIRAFPEQTLAGVGGVVMKYPFQAGSRIATGASVSIGFTPFVGIPTSGLAAYGSMFKDAYQHPVVVGAVGLVGEICSGP